MSQLSEFRRQERLMGSAFEFIIIASPLQGEKLLDECVEEVKRLERLLTEFSTSSETSMINQNAGGQPVQVSEEAFQLLKRSIDISKLTQGAFDISAGAIRKLYNFKGQEFEFPNDKKVRTALRKVGFEKIALRDHNFVRLQREGMHIGFGGIGKGYAADKVKSLLKAKGIESAVINASGDLTAWGQRLDGSPWRVGIADPDQKDKMMLWIPVIDASVATSGDYEQYFERGGIRYSHTIDPRTGKPVKGIKSVTVISPSAELCDSLATAVFIMGVEVGLHLIGQLPKTHALIINDQNKVFTSKDLKVNLGAQ